MAIKRENTPDGVKLRDTKTGKLAGSIPKGVKAPEAVEVPEVELPAPIGSADGDVWALWEREESARKLAELRKPPSEDWQERVSSGFVSYFERVVGWKRFEASDPRVTRELNVFMRDALNCFLKIYHGKLAAGVSEEDANAWYALQRAKMDFLHHWRYGPLLDCTVKWVDDEPRNVWQGERAVAEVKEVLSVVFDESVGYEELSAARLKFRLCPNGGWHRSNECDEPNAHQDGKVVRGFLPDVEDYSRKNSWHYGLSKMYYHEDLD